MRLTRNQIDAKMVDEREARETSTYVGKYFYCYDF